MHTAPLHHINKQRAQAMTRQQIVGALSRALQYLDFARPNEAEQEMIDGLRHLRDAIERGQEACWHTTGHTTGVMLDAPCDYGQPCLVIMLNEEGRG